MHLAPGARLSARLVTALAVALVAAGSSAVAMQATAAPAFAGNSGLARSAGAGRQWTDQQRATAAKKRKRASKPAKRQLPLKMMWGPLTLPNGASAFPIYHELGVQVLETQLSWAKTAPTSPGAPTNPADPAYSWPPALEQMISQAAQYGITVAVMVKNTPAWANGGQNESWAPNNAQDYANFMTAASRRYPTVHFWMIWGEPTRSGNFNPMPPNSPVGPRRYALLLDAAYGALKAVSTSNVVIGGMTWSDGLVTPPDFIRWMRLPDGQPPRLDYYGHNPYSTRFPNLKEGPERVPVISHGRVKLKPGPLRDINTIATLEAELAVAYRHRPGGAPKLWLSEFNVSSDAPNRAFDYFVSRAAQARWVTAAFKLVDSVPYVASLGWYDLLDEPASVPGHLTTGLLDENGIPKPAFNAYARAP